MELLKSVDQMTKAINSIKARGAKLETDIHICGVSVLAHADKHGDTTLCDRLVQAMPNGVRRNALVSWMLAWGSIAKLDTRDDKEAIAAGRLFKKDKSKKFDQASAEGESWTAHKPEPHPLTVFDAQKAVHGVLARIQKLGADETVTVEHMAEALAEARSLVEALETLEAMPKGKVKAGSKKSTSAV